MATSHMRVLRIDDIEAVTDLINNAYVADSVPMQISMDEVHVMVQNPHVEAALDARVATVGRDIVGYCVVTHRPSNVRQNNATVGGVVAAPYRDQGIGSELFLWGLNRATEKLRSADHDLPRNIRAFAYDWQDEPKSLFGKNGLNAVRYYDEMIKILQGPTGTETEGFDIVVFEERRSEAVLESLNAGFEDHWGSTPIDEATWQQWLQETTTRLDLSYLAIADDSVIGVLISAFYAGDEAMHGRREGWIESLSTIREWRNRGVASALIATACNAYIDEGLTHAALGVDTENPTGAAGLYRRAGFESERILVEYQREVV
jgi:ribosomal protein S18 acetylase RimI-like enzyme